MVWPNLVPVARTAKSGCWAKKARSSDVARLGAARAGDDGPAVLELADLGPELFKRRDDVARVLAPAAVGDCARQAREGFCPARGGVRLGLDDQKSPGRAEREPRNAPRAPTTGAYLFLRLKSPNSYKEPAQILALAIMRASDQRNVALAGGNARERNVGRVDALPTSSPMKVREVSADPVPRSPILPGQEVGELCQEKPSGASRLISRSLRKLGAELPLACALRMLVSTEISRSRRRRPR